MPAYLAPLLESLLADPVLLYSTGAALLLLAVSASSGFGRRDFLALARPRTLLRVLGAVAVAFLIEAAHVLWASALPEPLPALTAGLHRLPLHLIALAYGPATGAVVGVLFAGFHAGDGLPGWPEAVLTLELAVLGWLAIYPSPRVTRLAGPVNSLLAYALAWGTGGIALLAATRGVVTLDLLVAEHAALVPGLVACAVLLSLFGPRAYRAMFPGSRIYPPVPSRRAASGAGVGASRPALALAAGRELTLVAHDARRAVTLGGLAVESPMLGEALPGRRPRGERSLPALAVGELETGRPERRRRLEPRRLPEELTR